MKALQELLAFPATGLIFAGLFVFAKGYVMGFQSDDPQHGLSVRRETLKKSGGLFGVCAFFLFVVVGVLMKPDRWPALLLYISAVVAGLVYARQKGKG